MLDKIKNWYSKQSDTTKAMIWLGVIAVIGIILRWSHIIEQATRGFQYYSH